MVDFVTKTAQNEKKEVQKLTSISKFSKTLIFQIWWFCYTLGVRCNIEKKICQIMWFSIRFDVWVLCDDNLRPKIVILGCLRWAKMLKSRKCAKFYVTSFTFWPITQLSDVTASQDRSQMKAETKTFLTHPLRGLKNVYSIN